MITFVHIAYTPDTGDTIHEWAMHGTRKGAEEWQARRRVEFINERHDRHHDERTWASGVKYYDAANFDTSSIHDFASMPPGMFNLLLQASSKERAENAKPKAEERRPEPGKIKLTPNQLIVLLQIHRDGAPDIVERGRGNYESDIRYLHNHTGLIEASDEGWRLTGLGIHRLNQMVAG